MDSVGGSPIALEVARHALQGVAEEMGAALRRAAYSPNIKERADCSAAVFDAQGRMAAQAEHIPVHLGSMPASVEAVLERLGPLAPGSQALVNDPYAGGTHLPDLTLVAAVGDAGGRLLGYVANRAHHADVGGAAPGSMPAADTGSMPAADTGSMPAADTGSMPGAVTGSMPAADTGSMPAANAGSMDIAAEGLRIPPLLVADAQGVREDVLDLVVANSRTPKERRGDLRAQFAANHVGALRLRELAERYGVQGLADAMRSVCDYSDRLVRVAVAEIPDGVYRATDWLELDVDTPITATVTVDGDEVAVDFAGSAPQTGSNLNAVLAVTVSATWFVFRMLTDPHAPPNEGCYRACRVTAPAGSVVNATHPAAVAAGNVETSQRIVDTLLAAFAQALPDRVPAASQGTMNNVLIGASGGAPFSYYETLAGGEGGTPERAGMSGVHTGMTNTRNTPAEAVELAYPLRVWRSELRRGSGGAGLHPGGEGIVREIEALADCVLTLQTERRARGPWGLAGGGPGAPGRNVLVGADGSEQELPAKGMWSLSAGQRVRIETPGGGGWGDADDASA